jgi:DNA-binding response OmpR family regulator
MVVEDETSVRNFVASALRDEGYQLLLAASAEEAAHVSNEYPGAIDLLLTDAIMPGKSGIELASAMVADRPGLPVIIMSGYTKESLSVRGLAEPVNLLRKPFTPTELRRRIRVALGHEL